MAVKKARATRAKPKTAGKAARKPAAKKTAAKKPASKAKPKASSKPKAAKRASNASKPKSGNRALKALSNDPNAKLHENAGQLDTLIEDLTDLMQDFMDAADINQNLTPKERARLIGAGVRNYGFIEKTLDIARDNPSFLPPNFDVNDFASNLYEFDQIRQFYLLAEKLQTLASDSMLIKSNILYREALRVYNSLKEQARAGVPGARDLFNALETFFKRRRVAEKPETQKQEIHKAISLIKSRSDGEMVIKNIKPKKSDGVHEVVEEELKDDLRFKETEEGEIKE